MHRADLHLVDVVGEGLGGPSDLSSAGNDRAACTGIGRDQDSGCRDQLKPWWLESTAVVGYVREEAPTWLSLVQFSSFVQ